MVSTKFEVAIPFHVQKYYADSKNWRQIISDCSSLPEFLFEVQIRKA